MTPQSNIGGQPSGDAQPSNELDEILYHITHDVRAAIRAIRTLPVWLREDLEADGVALGDSALETLRLLQVQTDRADKMMTDLRTYSRVGRIRDEISTVPLKACIEEVADHIKLPQGFHLALDLNVHAIKAPANECFLLFGELMSNAVKHHDHSVGTISIASTVTRGQVCITVQDDGPGIEQMLRERVFGLMTTLRPRDECEGSGMGLSIARKIVTSLGGTIQITDTPSARGTRIEIRLPSTCATLSTIR